VIILFAPNLRRAVRAADEIVGPTDDQLKLLKWLDSIVKPTEKRSGPENWRTLNSRNDRVESRLFQYFRGYAWNPDIKPAGNAHRLEFAKGVLNEAKSQHT